MTPQDARAHYNFLLTLCLRKEESFGPLAFAFLKEHDLDQLQLTPEEQFNLYMATSEAFAAEPKRYNHKMECLQKAHQILRRTQYANPELARQLTQEIQKTSVEWDLYNEAMRAARSAAPPPSVDKQRLIVETDLPRLLSYHGPKTRLGLLPAEVQAHKRRENGTTFHRPFA